MSIKIQLECDGCFCTTELQANRRTFHSFSGKGYGLGVFEYPSLEKSLIPTGWEWCDPYTGCTYCPKCWEEINGAEEGNE